MDIDEWWPNLSDSVKEWLIANNGAAVPKTIVDEIVAAGGVVDEQARWFGTSAPDGLLLSDEATDWIEATANGENQGEI